MGKNDNNEDLAIQAEAVKLNRRQKVARHFHNNARVYLVGAGCLAIGAGLGMIYCLKSGKLVNAKQVQVLAYKSTQELTVWIEALGDPGNIVQDLTTGAIYASQGQAARALDVYPSMLVKHLNGEKADVKGHILKRLGKAAVSPLAE